MASAEKDLQNETEHLAGIPEEPQETSADVVRISFRVWLRSMLAIAWGVFRHPFSTTYVDLSTGESVHLPR